MRRRSRLRRSPLSMAMATLPTPLQRLPRALRGRRHPRGASHGRPGHAARQAGLRFLGWDWWAFGHAPMVPHQSEKKAPKAFASASTAPKKGGEQSIPPWRSDCWSCNGDIFEEEREGVPEQSLSRRRDRIANRQAVRHAAFSHPIDVSQRGEARGPSQPYENNTTASPSVHSAGWVFIAANWR
jgi:hypothetical protein